MNIALIGYGKMGKAIESLMPDRGHQAVLKIDEHNRASLTVEQLRQADVAIEFTGPDSAPENLLLCLEAGIPVVCGSTGWLDQWSRIKAACEAQNGALLYASNFSVGVNIFFALNQRLAELMNTHPEYEVSLTEIHHTAKRDAPSGTAITLAEGILGVLDRKKDWVNHLSDHPEELEILSERIDPAPGTHKVRYTSDIDDIEITHTAHNRKGFALGALLAAEYIYGKKGIYTMKQVLGL
ncbi:MAG TPA: 4-hydroxy-tetrahydrodipicolinate reductase [Dinghuibacter sp.]|jgi:4-hydroxy-tetrahydrodipicolinate reductase|uniref:4-hydroxy-tetrahydrodipicolinate reductase n=1 Tax=Dinghuibacter sp. TaxID=2024697 RepID=UPI002BCF23B5|nr:4-hydroxy-tetrahydrodipicolinate reductase [Dinghuibacter sp.]HTJ12932.1 4-hydroxy-tetrahydrodipicolinate reductase [Dinghuibacter sp.]